MTDYQANLILLALSCGFQTVERNGQIFLMTIYKNKTQMYSINEESENAFMGKEDEILSIIDSRLGVNFSDNELKKRFDVFFGALSDENHSFWNKAKSKQ